MFLKESMQNNSDSDEEYDIHPSRLFMPFGSRCTKTLKFNLEYVLS